MSDCMTFPDTVEEFMEQYKIIDTEQVYTNGAELVPIFRMKQWFEHLQTFEPERKKGKWILVTDSNGQHFICDHCGEWRYRQNQKFCGECGADMREGEQE